MARKASLIELNENEQKILKKTSKGRTENQSFIERSKIILLASQGKQNQEITKELGITHPTVSKWRKRWLTSPPLGEKKHFERDIKRRLTDEKRSGSPTKFTQEDLCQIYKMACEKPEDYGAPLSKWTISELQRNLKEKKGLSVSRGRLFDFLKDGKHLFNDN